MYLQTIRIANIKMKKKQSKTQNFQDPISILKTEAGRSRMDAGYSKMQSLVFELDNCNTGIKEGKKRIVEELDFSAKEASFFVKAYITGDISAQLEKLMSSVALRYEITGLDSESVEAVAESGALQSVKDATNRQRLNDFLEDISGLYGRAISIKEEMKELQDALVESLSCSPADRKVIISTLKKPDISKVIATEEGYIQLLNAYQNGQDDTGEDTSDD